MVANDEQPLDYSGHRHNNDAALDPLGGFVLFLFDDGFAGDPAEARLQRACSVHFDGLSPIRLEVPGLMLVRAALGCRNAGESSSPGVDHVCVARLYCFQARDLSPLGQLLASFGPYALCRACPTSSTLHS